MEEEKQAPISPQEKRRKKKKKKTKFVDDGHTVYSMEGLSDAPKKEKVGLTRKERRAAIRAGLSVYMPRVLLVIGCFTVAFLIIYLWLN